MVSQLVVQRATNKQIRLLAQAEVEKQTHLASKLKEIANAKNVSLTIQIDTQTQQMLGKYEKLCGAQIDLYYIAESAIKEHEKLDKVMTNIKFKAQDSNLKTLAAAIHPMVSTYAFAGITRYTIFHD